MRAKVGFRWIKDEGEWEVAAREVDEKLEETNVLEIIGGDHFKK